MAGLHGRGSTLSNLCSSYLLALRPQPTTAHSCAPLLPQAPRCFSPAPWALVLLPGRGRPRSFLEPHTVPAVRVRVLQGVGLLTWRPPRPRRLNLPRSPKHFLSVSCCVFPPVLITCIFLLYLVCCLPSPGRPGCFCQFCSLRCPSSQMPGAGRPWVSA